MGREGEEPVESRWGEKLEENGSSLSQCAIRPLHAELYTRRNHQRSQKTEQRGFAALRQRPTRADRRDHASRQRDPHRAKEFHKSASTVRPRTAGVDCQRRCAIPNFDCNRLIWTNIKARCFRPRMEQRVALNDGIEAEAEASPRKPSTLKSPANWLLRYSADLLMWDRSPLNGMTYSLWAISEENETVSHTSNFTLSLNNQFSDGWTNQIIFDTAKRYTEIWKASVQPIDQSLKFETANTCSN